MKIKLFSLVLISLFSTSVLANDFSHSALLKSCDFNKDGKIKNVKEKLCEIKFTGRKNQFEETQRLKRNVKNR